MWFSKNSILLFSFILVALFQTPTAGKKQSYIVYLGSHSHGPEASLADYERVTESHYSLLGSFLRSEARAKDAIFYSYTKHINGFAATLQEEEAAEIARHPKVVSVFLNKKRELHTTHSWDFLRLEKDGTIHSSSLWKKARFGEDTIIGNLDTGVWPESKSFTDEGYGPIPARWKGLCQNDTTIGVSCNRKLIGSRSFSKGYEADGAVLNSSDRTPRDYDGHGTHTLSTAGGNFVSGASVCGMANGTVKGGSPKARLAAYKVCWSGCYDADILAGFDAAIHDGVDVLSVSLGGASPDYVEDSISIGAFHATKKGILVVCSAGNSGPLDGTASNLAPWILTVGASTIDREFQAYVELQNGKRLKGTSLSHPMPEGRFHPLISGAQAKSANATVEDAMLCKPNTLDDKKVKGKILACLRGDTARVDKGEQALLAGAVGMILCNDESSGNEIITDLHVLPASHIDYKDGVVVFAFINSTKDPQAFITAPISQLNTKPAPYMASFSSKGPNIITPEILKPDITAPGVSIVAAYSEGASPTDESFDKRITPFNTESGTSMSCPHVSGVAGLLKTLHPHWSPAAIKSAIMTTARTRDNLVGPMLDSSFQKANPFSYGAGHIRPNRAMDPGLVYDLNANDYLDFLCALGYNDAQIELFSDSPYKCPKSVSLLDINYPSITVPNLSGSITMSRTLKNVGSPGTYTASVREPAGISVSIEPQTLKFDKIGEGKSFKMTLKVKNAKRGVQDYVFGRVTWSDGKHYVRSPIVVAGVSSA